MHCKRYEGKIIAKNYNTFRPRYPESLSEAILQFLDQKLPKSFSRKLALDVGCGSGQSTECIAPFFENVIGVDISKDQISEGRKNNQFENVEYLVGSFDRLPAKDNSVSLVICGTAAHWFNPIDEFYKEAKRVLIPGGCIAIFGYSNSFISGLPTSLNNTLNVFFQTIFSKITTEIPKGMENLLNEYQDFDIPFEDVIRSNTLSMSKKSTFNSYVGFYKSVSLYRSYKEKNNKDPFEENTKE
ncbi:DgyrCDS14670 [Dimorphilus gyrociliatus]|uniref:DgyrCDS14670 n=1 Tax=Dimorphilus gyrociliatus TaxID=2664684 RepID=A0A7I8WEL6_9ANNE|nr:DgyrCDS14670 [Dimorphilus gyrociliatus]